MKQIESRIRKLEQHVPDELIAPKIFAISVPVCSKGGPCDHITGATAEARGQTVTLARGRGESVKELTDRVIACTRVKTGDDVRPWAMVEYIGPCNGFIDDDARVTRH